MKIKSISIILLLSFAVIFNSCKKSENDPLLPFSTRDARISNTWVLVSMSKTVLDEETRGITFKTTKIFVFDGTNMTKTTQINEEEPTEVVYPYSHELDIKKDGTYTQIITSDGNKIETGNTWFWYDSVKDKVGIILSDSETYMIDRLAKDELILTQNSDQSSTDSEGTITHKSEDVIMTFNKK